MNPAIQSETGLWRNRILDAVSPLESGVAQLAVQGYKPLGQLGYRPRRTAAVLVPLLDLDQPQIVLTRRAEHLPQHAGQVSFPGGAAEAHDQSAVHTALREAYEEIGLPPDRVTPLGFLDRLDTISDYRVLPVVALVKGPVLWQPDQREVAEVFTVPLPHVMNLEQYENRPVERSGVEYSIWYLHYQQHIIWGATAAILLNFALRFRATDHV